MENYIGTKLKIALHNYTYSFVSMVDYIGTKDK